MLRLIKYLVVLTLLAALATPVVLLVAGLQPDPLVVSVGKPTHRDIARAKALVEKYDPRQEGVAGEVRSLPIPEQDLTLMLDYGIGRFLPAAARVGLGRGSADIALTVRVPENPLGGFFNLHLTLSPVPGGIRIDGLRFGGLEVPGALASGILSLVGQVLQNDETYRAVVASVNGIRIGEGRLVLVYQWQPNLLDQVRSRGSSLLIEQAERERLLAYWGDIAAVTRESLFGGALPLADLMTPVFREARNRTLTSGDAAKENRSAILTLAFYIQGVNLPRLLGEDATADLTAEPRRLELQGRQDFAQHFLLSAGIAVAGGSPVANAVGLFKELDDSRGGSGFSFTDLAADRAGVRFSEAATGPGASRIQDLIAESADESLFMPDARDLPEFLPEAEFRSRFGGVGAPAYERIARDIETRIAALEIHQ